MQRGVAVGGPAALVPMPPPGPRQADCASAAPRRIIIDEGAGAAAAPSGAERQPFDVLGDFSEYVGGLEREEADAEEEASNGDVGGEGGIDGGGSKSPTSIGRMDIGALPEDIAYAADQLGSTDPAMSSLLISTYRRKKLEREVIQQYATAVRQGAEAEMGGTSNSRGSTLPAGAGLPPPPAPPPPPPPAAAAEVSGSTGVGMPEFRQSALDTYLDLRQERSLRRWEHYCRLWERERRKLHANLNLPSDHPYIMDSADEYRKKIEVLDTLDRAVPLEERHGSDQWTMSLRNNWARYVPVGNIFSGLFCPVEERQRGFDDLIKVGKPRGSSTTAVHADNNRARGWHQSSHLALRLMQFSKRVEGFPKYDPDMTMLEVEGRSVVKDLLDLADKQITLEEIEAEVRASNEDVWLEMKEARRRMEANAAAKAVAHDAMVSSEAIRAETPADAADAAGTRGPAVSVSRGQLSLFCDANRSATDALFVTNTGSTAIYYEWARMPAQELALAPAAEGADGGGAAAAPPPPRQRQPERVRFFFSAITGCLLPGRTHSFKVTFKSAEPGIFEEEWALCTSPKTALSADGGNLVTLRGVCSPPTNTLSGLYGLGDAVRTTGMIQTERTLAARVQMRQVGIALDNLLNATVASADARAAEAAAAGPAADAGRDDSVLRFAEANPGLFYNAADYGRLERVYDRLSADAGARGGGAEGDDRAAAEGDEQPDADGDAAAAEAGAGGRDEEPAWDGSVDHLRTLIDAVGDGSGADDDIQPIVDSMMVPSSRHDMLLMAMRDALGALATAIEEHVDGFDAAGGEEEEEGGQEEGDAPAEAAEDGGLSAGSDEGETAADDAAAGADEGGTDEGGAGEAVEGDEEEPAEAAEGPARRSAESLESLLGAVRPVAASLAERFFGSLEAVEDDVRGVIDGRLEGVSRAIDAAAGVGAGDVPSELTWSAFDLERVKHGLSL